MPIHFLIFFLSAGLIYFSCEYFVNAIEWCGSRMNLGAVAVGSLLAAFGTTLPESIVTLIAVVFGRTLLVSSSVTLLAIALLWLLFRHHRVQVRALPAVCLLYGIFAVFVGYNFLHRWQQVPAPDHARVNPVGREPQALRSGAQLYQQRCQQCHQQGGRGNGHYPALRSQHLRAATDCDIEWFLRQGDMGQGMPSWSHLPDQQRWQIVAYLKSIQMQEQGIGNRV